MTTVLVDELVYCGCGCGQPTNLKHLRARELVAAGWTHRKVAAEFGCERSYIGMLLRMTPPGYIKGHLRITGPCPILPCIVCGEPFKAIGSRDCCNDHTCGAACWRVGLRSTPKKQAEFDRFGSVLHSPSKKPRAQRVLEARAYLADLQFAREVGARLALEARAMHWAAKRLARDERIARERAEQLERWQRRAEKHRERERQRLLRQLGRRLRALQRTLEGDAQAQERERRREERLARQACEREQRLQERLARQALARERRAHLRRLRWQSQNWVREVRIVTRALKRERDESLRQQYREQRERRAVERRVKRAFAQSRELLSLDYQYEDQEFLKQAKYEMPLHIGMGTARSAEDEALERMEREAPRDEASGMSCGECGRMQSKREWIRGACPRCGSATFAPSRYVREERISPEPQVGLGQSNGVVHHMSSRHRGRNAQSALMAGSRNSRKPRSKR